MANKQLYLRYDHIAEMEIIMKMEHALNLIVTIVIVTFKKDEPTVKLLKLIAIRTNVTPYSRDIATREADKHLPTCTASTNSIERHLTRLLTH